MEKEHHNGFRSFDYQLRNKTFFSISYIYLLCWRNYFGIIPCWEIKPYFPGKLISCYEIEFRKVIENKILYTTHF